MGIADKKIIGVIGLGYVGLPVAVSMAKHFKVIGFDVHKGKIEAIRRGEDPTREGLEELIRASGFSATDSVEDLRPCNFFIVCVPTPIDENRNPDLTPVLSACRTIGAVLKKGDIVVFESTVFPGVTEDICGPLLEEISKLSCGKDFKLGYSPERINPGDKEHTFENILKVVSGQDPETSEEVAAVYSRVVEAGVFRASTIRVAEAAKVIENTQRDVNIALMNELALIFDRMNIRTVDVLKAAKTKWNFLPFSPGLVGGHCIGVDPYYLTSKAQQLGYHPQVILSGRRINDDMGRYIAQRTVKLLIHADIPPKGARVGILGITFKENVADVRNSRVPDIYQELHAFGIEPLVHDPVVSAEECKHEYGIQLAPIEKFDNLDALIVAVSHKEFMSEGVTSLCKRIRKGGIFVDVKSAFSPDAIPNSTTYWSL